VSVIVDIGWVQLYLQFSAFSVMYG